MFLSLMIGISFLSAQTCDPQNNYYNYESFENNLGIWNDGGNDAIRAAFNATQGTYSVRLQDNSGVQSSIYTDALDFSGISQAVVNFSFKQRGFEPGEDFKLQVSTNGGAYITVFTWVAGIHFPDQSSYKNKDNTHVFGPYNASVLINVSSANTRFRIMADASANDDRVFIDKLEIATDLCDDGVVTTVNDTYNENCICLGEQIDYDGDGVYQGVDPNDLNPCLDNTTYPCLVCGTPENAENFDNGWGTWNSGGNDAYLNSVAGFDVAVIRDNSNYLSSIYSNPIIDFPEHYTSFSFNYYASGLEAGENFILEYSIDNGLSYIEVKSFVSGIHFFNNTVVSEYVEITDGLTGETVIFRLRCDASDDTDVILIDNIVIKPCTISQPRLANPESEEVAQLSDSFNIYPNPTKSNSQININLKDVDAVAESIAVYDINGKLMEMKPIEEEELLLSISTTGYSQGTYVLILNTKAGSIMKKFMVNN